jgi:hypothetical protein
MTIMMMMWRGVAANEVAEPTPSVGPAPLVVAGNRVARLVGEELEVWSADLKQREARVPLGSEAKALGVLADGSILAVAGMQVCTLAPAATSANCHPKLTVADGRTVAWGDAQEARRFWLAEKSFVLQAELPTTDGAKVTELAGYNFRQFPDQGVAVLAGGQIAFVDAPDLRVLGPGVDRRLALPEGVRPELIAGAGADHVWFSVHGSSLVRASIAGDKVTVEKRVELPGTVVVSLGADGAQAAALIATRPGKPKWSLLVVDKAGKEVLREATPWQPTPVNGGLWVAGPRDGKVAVGDATRLAVWDLSAKKLLGRISP